MLRDELVAYSRVDQRLIVCQIPSEANAERLLNERLSDELAGGWRAIAMQDHNGFLVFLLEKTVEVRRG